jgi:putative glutamine amidotransferase
MWNDLEPATGRPRIAIPIPTSKDDAYNERCWPMYAAAVSLSGGEPIPVELDQKPEKIARLVSSCAGVLLPGSPADVNPEKYGEPREPESAPADRLREVADDLLLQDAQNMRKPLFCVCYGVQSLNVWSGGTLIQHLPDEPVFHKAGAKYAVAHAMRVEPGSRIASATDELGLAAINSSHHQAIKSLGDGLRVTARSIPDDVVEAVEGTRVGHFVLGTQWHPERGFDEDALSQDLFRQFIDAARDWRPRPAE